MFWKIKVLNKENENCFDDFVEALIPVWFEISVFEYLKMFGVRHMWGHIFLQTASLDGEWA